MSTSQRAVVLCGWGVGSKSRHGLFAGETVAISEPLKMLQYLKALYKCPGLLLLQVLLYLVGYEEGVSWEGSGVLLKWR